MRDPHIVSLQYCLVTDEPNLYNSPAPVVQEEEAFSIRLENDVFFVEMKQHFASEKTARDEVEKYLYAWKVKTALMFGPGEFDYQFIESHCIDRDPPPPGTPITVTVDGCLTAVVDAVAKVQIRRSKYPLPPKYFRASSDFDTLWQRYQGYCAGREPLQSMAYFCLTVIEIPIKREEEEEEKNKQKTNMSRSKQGKKGRTREKAAPRISVSFDVLDKLGRLTANCGDRFTARKAQTTYQDLSELEEKWIKKAVRLLILRVAEHDYLVKHGADPSTCLTEINMSHLPKLP